MKKIYFVVIAALFLVSCSDFLDYNEDSDYGKEYLFNTRSMNEAFVTNIYTYLPGALSDVGEALRSAGCDEAEYVWPTSIVHRFYDGSWSPIRTIDDKWDHYYTAIRACNNYLENGVGKEWEQFQYEKDYETNMLRYRNLEWEVKALRAYFYFELVKRYNRIPLITKVLTDEEANNQSPVYYQDIVDFIVDQCNEVAQEGRLPAIYTDQYNNETGRVSKIFALALKARALLYAASPLNNPEADAHPDKWIKAAQAAKVVMDSASVWGLKMNVNYTTITGADNYKNTEMILAKRLGDSNDFERINFPIGLEGGKTGNCPTQNLVDVFDIRKGRVFDPAKPYDNRDPRLAATVAYHGGNTAYGQTIDVLPNGANGLPKEGATKTGYYLAKFVNRTVSLTANNTTMTRHSIPLFRYAEILLIYAEAMNQAYGPSGTGEDLELSAIEAINMVRSRNTFLDLIKAEDTPEKKDFQLVLQKERMAELAFEDHRFWDIRRWKIGPKTTTIKRVSITKGEDGALSYHYYETNDRMWDDKMYFYPIAQAERYKNSNLVQNPGWEQ